MKVSIIMTSYNHAKYVGKAIESVLNQTFKDWEFIIIDDASSDDSVDVIASYADPRIKFFDFKENKGMVYCVNQAIKIAQGEYIAHLNSDDTWEPQKLQKQVDFLDDNRNFGAVFTRANLIDKVGNITKKDKKNPFLRSKNQTRFEWLRYFIFNRNCLCYPSVMVRKDCYNSLGLYDQRFSIMLDLDMWIRILSFYEIHILEERLTNFRCHDNESNNYNLAIHEAHYVLNNYKKFDDFTWDLFFKGNGRFRDYFEIVENEGIPLENRKYFLQELFSLSGYYKADNLVMKKIRFLMKKIYTNKSGFIEVLGCKILSWCNESDIFRLNFAGIRVLKL